LRLLKSAPMSATGGQNAKYSPGVDDFWIAPDNGHRHSSRMLRESLFS
jgi:hypothetical protein